MGKYRVQIKKSAVKEMNIYLAETGRPYLIKLDLFPRIPGHTTVKNYPVRKISGSLWWLPYSLFYWRRYPDCLYCQSGTSERCLPLMARVLMWVRRKSYKMTYFFLSSKFEEVNMTVKDRAKNLINSLPPKPRWMILSTLYMSKPNFNMGNKRIRQRKGISHEDAKKRLRKWVK